jgi:hypothetical protein
MWIRACLITLVLLAVLGGAGDCIGCYVRISHSLVALPQPEAPLSPVDRFILALILARDDKDDKAEKQQRGTRGI